MNNTDLQNKSLEELLLDLRMQKQWTYLDIVDELYKLGITVDEKTVKKWELGLSYPDLNIIYKLSELYFISSQDLLKAKENSYTKGYNNIHMTIIKWFCYFTGFTLKIGYIFFFIALTLVTFGALFYFVNQVNLLKGLSW